MAIDALIQLSRKRRFDPSKSRWDNITQLEGIPSFKGCSQRELRGQTAARPTINPEKIGSIPHMALIELDSVLLEHLPELALEYQLPTMFFLQEIALAHGFDLREAD